MELYGIDVQKQVFSDLFHFTQIVYPERLQDNTALAEASGAFQKLSFEENAEVIEQLVVVLPGRQKRLFGPQMVYL